MMINNHNLLLLLLSLNLPNPLYQRDLPSRKNLYHLFPLVEVHLQHLSLLVRIGYHTLCKDQHVSLLEESPAAAISVAQRLHKFESQSTPKLSYKATPPPKPPLSTKPTIPANKPTIQPTQTTSTNTTTTITPTTTTTTPSPSPPVAPPRPKLKQQLTGPETTHHRSSDVYISPVAAPLDPAMDVPPPEPRIRRRETKKPNKDAEILSELRTICTDADPTKLYRNMIKVGQG